ncbi:MerR family transcriptional regulator [Amycolatopsis keratiniphila]|uniref:HTH merR-type domain-containing protein n=1 Tax=Amycolatopsis keratiniphila TaxID=129921 RepID=W6HVT5_9PSEU|nr:MerR family transcriptional regulator [Amycolatopsis keratiniphila]AHJ58564.1 hypothetical protein AORI_P049 [Amycolatopsis keratiniphila]
MTKTLIEDGCIQDAWALVEQLEDARDAVQQDPCEGVRRLNATIDSALAAMSPVSVSAAAKLLELSQPTVRAWLDKGVLTEAERRTSSVRQLDPHRLHLVLHLVNTLRERGTKTNDLMDKVWWRLSDQAVLDRDDLQESLAQMRRGELIDL